MKVRNGFVSNSSSSSFMIGIAKIRDFALFQEWFRKFEKLTKYECKVLTVGYTKDENGYWDYYESNSGDISIESFMGDVVEIKKGRLNPGDKVFVINVILNEGDCVFDKSGEGDYNYDIDLDWFGDIYQELYCGLGEGNVFAYVDKSYGAGRNG